MASPSPAPERPPGSRAARRILIYSYDSYGLGHLRRCLTLAEGLVKSLPEASVLLVSGSPCATQFELPPRVDVLKLPSVTKDEAGRYRPRCLPGSLEAVVRMRRRLLLEACRSFQAELLVVDHQPLGLCGELRELLDETRLNGVTTVLGLRDVVDAPDAVARQWSSPEVRRALAQRYDHVCVYGSEGIFDPRVEYPLFRGLGDRMDLLGYVVRPLSDTARTTRPRGDRPHVLMTVGGGEDGAARAEAWLDAMTASPRPDWRSTIVLGPLMDPAQARRIRARARRVKGVRVHRFYQDVPRLLAGSSAVVSMAGYNSVAEILRSRVPAVLCPRIFPRREQLLRAERLAARGLARLVVKPDPRGLRSAVEAALERGPVDAETPPLDGMQRFASLAGDLLQVPVRTSEQREAL